MRNTEKRLAFIPFMGGKTSKFLSISLSILYFSANCLLAHSAETNFWSDRQKKIQNETSLAFLDSAAMIKSQLQMPVAANSSLTKSPETFKAVKENAALASVLHAVPAQFGSVRKISLPKNQAMRGVVLHVQDIHLNNEAQSNISRTIASLIENNKAGAVALEGGFDAINLDGIRGFKYQEAVKDMADYFLKTNQIQGPIHAALTSGKKIPAFVGIDDAQHYHANVDAYRTASKLIPAAKKELADEERALAEKKRAVFNRELAAFDAKSAAYHQGKIGMGDYVGELGQLKTENIARFLEALKLERSIDFKRVESERARVVEKLVSKLNKAGVGEFLNWSVAYRSGQVSHGDFYSYVRTLCGDNGIELAAYPAMDGYIRYVLLADAIDAEKLFAEIKTAEDAMVASLAKTEAEKNLMAESRRVILTGKLLDFALTKEEWHEYKVLSNQFSVLSNLRTNKLRTENFEKFYEEAEFRDERMASNLLRGTRDKGLGTIVLVTGGFHAQGIAQHLTDAGYAVVNFVPKITKVEDENGTSYLGVFTQEKTPLEKMFEGPKLFLGMEIQPAASRASQAMVAGGQAVNRGLATPETAAQEIKTADAELADAAVKKTADGADVTVQNVTVSVKGSSKGIFSVSQRRGIGWRQIAASAALVLSGGFFSQIKAADAKEGFIELLKEKAQEPPYVITTIAVVLALAFFVYYTVSVRRRNARIAAEKADQEKALEAMAARPAPTRRTATSDVPRARLGATVQMALAFRPQKNHHVLLTNKSDSREFLSLYALFRAGSDTLDVEITNTDSALVFPPLRAAGENLKLELKMGAVLRLVKRGDKIELTGVYARESAPANMLPGMALAWRGYFLGILLDTPSVDLSRLFMSVRAMGIDVMFDAIRNRQTAGTAEQQGKAFQDERDLSAIAVELKEADLGFWNVATQKGKIFDRPEPEPIITGEPEKEPAQTKAIVNKPAPQVAPQETDSEPESWEPFLVRLAVGCVLLMVAVIGGGYLYPLINWNAIVSIPNEWKFVTVAILFLAVVQMQLIRGLRKRAHDRGESTVSQLGILMGKLKGFLLAKYWDHFNFTNAVSMGFIVLSIQHLYGILAASIALVVSAILFLLGDYLYKKAIEKAARADEAKFLVGGANGKKVLLQYLPTGNDGRKMFALLSNDVGMAGDETGRVRLVFNVSASLVVLSDNQQVMHRTMEYAVENSDAKKLQLVFSYDTPGVGRLVEVWIRGVQYDIDWLYDQMLKGMPPTGPPASGNVSPQSPAPHNPPAGANGHGPNGTNGQKKGGDDSHFTFGFIKDWFPIRLPGRKMMTGSAIAFFALFIDNVKNAGAADVAGSALEYSRSLIADHPVLATVAVVSIFYTKEIFNAAGKTVQLMFGQGAIRRWVFASVTATSLFGNTLGSFGPFGLANRASAQDVVAPDLGIDELDKLLESGSGRKAFQFPENSVDLLQNDLLRAGQGMGYYDREAARHDKMFEANKRGRALYARLNGLSKKEEDFLYAAFVRAPSPGQQPEKALTMPDPKVLQPTFKTKSEYNKFFDKKENRAKVHVYLAYSDPEVVEYVRKLGLRVIGAQIMTQVKPNGELMDQTSIAVLEANDIAIEVWYGDRANRDDERNPSYMLATGKVARMADLDYAVQLYNTSRTRVGVVQQTRETTPPRPMKRLRDINPNLPRHVVGGAEEANPTTVQGTQIPARIPHHENQRPEIVGQDEPFNLATLKTVRSYIDSGLATADASSSEPSVETHENFWNVTGPQMLAHMPGETSEAADAASATDTAAKQLHHAVDQLERVFNVKPGEVNDWDAIIEAAQRTANHHALVDYTARAHEFFQVVQGDRTLNRQRMTAAAMYRYLRMMAELVEEQIDDPATMTSGKMWKPADGLNEGKWKAMMANPTVKADKDLIKRLDDLKLAIAEYQKSWTKLDDTVKSAKSVEKILAVVRDGTKMSQVMLNLQAVDTMVFNLLRHPEMSRNAALCDQVLGLTDWRGAILRTQIRNGVAGSKEQGYPGVKAIQADLVNTLLIRNHINAPRIFLDLITAGFGNDVVPLQGLTPEKGKSNAAPQAAPSKQTGIDERAVPMYKKSFADTPVVTRTAVTPLAPSNLPIAAPFEKVPVNGRPVNLGKKNPLPAAVASAGKAQMKAPSLPRVEIPKTHAVVEIKNGDKVVSLPILPAPANAHAEFLLRDLTFQTALGISSDQLLQLKNGAITSQQIGWIVYVGADDKIVPTEEVQSKYDMNRRQFVIDPAKLAELTFTDTSRATKMLLEAGALEVIATHSAASAATDKTEENVDVARNMGILKQQLRHPGDERQDLALRRNDWSQYKGIRLFSEQNLLDQSRSEKGGKIKIYLPALHRYVTTEDFLGARFYTDVAREREAGRYKFLGAGKEVDEYKSVKQLRRLGHVLTFDNRNGKRINNSVSFSPLQDTRNHVYYVVIDGNHSNEVITDNLFPEIENLTQIKGDYENHLLRVEGGEFAAEWEQKEKEHNMRVAVQGAFVAMSRVRGVLVPNTPPNAAINPAPMVNILGVLSTEEAVTKYKKDSKYRVIEGKNITYSVDRNRWLTRVTAVIPISDTESETWTWNLAPGGGTQVSGSKVLLVDGLNRIMDEANLSEFIHKSPNGDYFDVVYPGGMVTPDGTIHPIRTIVDPSQPHTTDTSNLEGVGARHGNFQGTSLVVPMNVNAGDIVSLKNPNWRVWPGWELLAMPLQKLEKDARQRQQLSDYLDFQLMIYLFGKDLPRIGSTTGNPADSPLNLGGLFNNMNAQSMTPFILRGEYDVLARLMMTNMRHWQQKQEAIVITKNDFMNLLSLQHPTLQFLKKNTDVVLRDPSDYPEFAAVTQPSQGDQSRMLFLPNQVGLYWDGQTIYEIPGTDKIIIFGEPALLRQMRLAVMNYYINPKMDVMSRFHGGMQVGRLDRFQGANRNKQEERLGLYPVNYGYFYLGSSDAAFDAAARDGVRIQSGNVIQFETTVGGLSPIGKAEGNELRSSVFTVQAVPGIQGVLIPKLKADADLTIARAEARLYEGADGKYNGGWTRIPVEKNMLQKPVEQQGADGFEKGSTELRRVLNETKDLSSNADLNVVTLSNGNIVYNPGANQFFEWKAIEKGKWELVAVNILVPPFEIVEKQAVEARTQFNNSGKEQQLVEGNGGVRDLNLTTGEVIYHSDPDKVEDILAEIRNLPMPEQMQIAQQDYVYQFKNDKGETIVRTFEFGATESALSLSRVALPSHKASWDALLAAHKAAEAKGDRVTAAALQRAIDQGPIRDKNLNDFVVMHDKGGAIVVRKGQGHLLRIETLPAAVHRQLERLAARPYTERKAAADAGFVYDLGNDHIAIMFPGDENYADDVRTYHLLALNTIAQIETTIGDIKAGRMPPTYHNGVLVSELFPENVDRTSESGTKFGPDGYVWRTVTDLMSGEKFAQADDTNGNVGKRVWADRGLTRFYNGIAEDWLSLRARARCEVLGLERDARGDRMIYSFDEKKDVLATDSDGLISKYRVRGKPSAGRNVPGGDVELIYEIVNWRAASGKFPAMRLSRRLSETNEFGTLQFFYKADGSLDRTEFTAKDSKGNVSKKTTRAVLDAKGIPVLDNAGNFLSETTVEPTNQKINTHSRPSGSMAIEVNGFHTSMVRHPDDPNAWLYNPDSGQKVPKEGIDFDGRRPAKLIRNIEIMPNGDVLRVPFLITTPLNVAGKRIVRLFPLSPELVAADGTIKQSTRKHTYLNPNTNIPEQFEVATEFDRAAEVDALKGSGLSGVSSKKGSTLTLPDGRKIPLQRSKSERGFVEGANGKKVYQQSVNLRLTPEAHDYITQRETTKEGGVEKSRLTDDDKASLRRDRDVGYTITTRQVPMSLKLDDGGTVTDNSMRTVRRDMSWGGHLEFHYDIPNLAGMPTRVDYYATKDQTVPETRSFLASPDGQPLVPLGAAAREQFLKTADLNAIGLTIRQDEEGLYRYVDYGMDGIPKVDTYMDPIGRILRQYYRDVEKTVFLDGHIQSPWTDEMKPGSSKTVKKNGEVEKEVRTTYPPELLGGGADESVTAAGAKRSPELFLVIAAFFGSFWAVTVFGFGKDYASTLSVWLLLAAAAPLAVAVFEMIWTVSSKASFANSPERLEQAQLALMLAKGRVLGYNNPLNATVRLATASDNFGLFEVARQSGVEIIIHPAFAHKDNILKHELSHLRRDGSVAPASLTGRLAHATVGFVMREVRARVAEVTSPRFNEEEDVANLVARALAAIRTNPNDPAVAAVINRIIAGRDSSVGLAGVGETAFLSRRHSTRVQVLNILLGRGLNQEAYRVALAQSVRRVFGRTPSAEELRSLFMALIDNVAVPHNSFQGAVVTQTLIDQVGSADGLVALLTSLAQASQRALGTNRNQVYLDVQEEVLPQVRAALEIVRRTFPAVRFNINEEAPASAAELYDSAGNLRVDNLERRVIGRWSEGLQSADRVWIAIADGQQLVGLGQQTLLNRQSFKTVAEILALLRAAPLGTRDLDNLDDMINFIVRFA